MTKRIHHKAQNARRLCFAIYRLTRFMIRVRSPWASSSGVGGSGRFGGPPGCVELVAEPSLGRRPPGLYENSGLVRKRHAARYFESFYFYFIKLNSRIEIKIKSKGLGTHSGFGGSLASKVPSFLVRSLGSSGSLSESDVSIGSSGLTGWLLLLLLLGVVCLATAAAVADCERLLRGGASGCDCDCWGEIPNSFNCAASMSKS